MPVEPYTVGAFIVSTASLVTAGAATFAAKWIREMRSEVSRNSRVLHGEEDVEAWGGLVRMVHEHRQALKESDDLEGIRPDRGDPEEVRRRGAD